MISVDLVCLTYIARGRMMRVAHGPDYGRSRRSYRVLSAAALWTGAVIAFQGASALEARWLVR
jgi:hypothetical protein